MAIRIQDLYTFHVVARTGAMQEAAVELGVTPSAISQRIRTVEDRHGLRLFKRSKTGIELTKAGRDLQADIGAAFVTIEAAQSRHFDRQRTTIRISTSATFAHATLVSCLGRFSEHHPGISVSVETGYRLVDLRSEPIDIAIRHGLGDYPGFASQWLYAPELIVVASPDLLAKQGPPRNPADCLKYTLLPDSTGQDWPIWLKALGIDASAARYGPSYGDDLLTVRAAVDGQGLALLNDISVRPDLEAGRLVRALDATWPTAFGYYAVALPETFDRPPVATFVRWLKQDLQSLVSEETAIAE